MCYNCGCGNSKDDHKDPRNITDKTFSNASDATNDMEADDAKQNTVNLLKKKGDAA